MRLSAPSFLIFLISLACGVLSLLPMYGIILVNLPISGYWLMTIAWIALVIGVVFRRA